MADVFVAILRIRPEAMAQLAQREKFPADQLFFGPADFDLLMAVPPPPLLAAGPSCSSRVQIEHQALALPRCRALRGERAKDAALRFVGGLDSKLLTRAVNIPLANLEAQSNKPGTSTSPPPLRLSSSEYSPQLVLLPITHCQAPERHLTEGLEFCPFATVLHAAMNYDGTLVESNSQNQLVRLGEWLSQGQCRTGSAFVHSLFLAPSKRVLRTVHNPILVEGEQQKREIWNRSQSMDKENSASTSEIHILENEFITEKLAAPEGSQNRVELKQVKKYDRFVVNPLFGTDIPSRRKAMAPDYFVQGRQCVFPKRRRRSTGAGNGSVQQQRSPTEFWEQQYPLHKHAFDGNAQRIRELLAQGFDPNELDNDFWTPLHYCAFYNRLEACQCLLLDTRTDVNVPNRTGATPMHFAALNGHVYVAELLLSHQFADINIRDSHGKTPLDLCAPVPKPDWQGVAFLLQQSVQLRPTKVEVQLVGGPALQVEVGDAIEATAGELRTKVLQLEGLEPELGAQIFAIWLVDSRLCLQLKAEQKVQVHLNKWPEHLEKFGGEPPSTANEQESNFGGTDEERVRVVLKRDARTLLGDEKILARKSPVAVSLLYGEAVDQFLRGMFPCHEKHFLPMAAIVARHVYGAEWPQRVDANFLGRVLPHHLVPAASDIRAFASLSSKLRQAHRQLAGLNLVQLQLRFLNLCWSLNVYGCTFFRAFMLMAKPLRGNLQVQVGLNDWGMCVLNAASHRQVAAIEMDKLEVKFTPGTHFLEVQNRKRDFVATVTTPQVTNFFDGFRFGGHRGSPVNAPENTMASFMKAAHEGVDLIEFDVGLTKDNVPVLLHDDSLDRTTNMCGPLRDKTLAELAACNCAANFKPPFAPLDGPQSEMDPAPIPTMEQLVKWAKARGMKMIFDVKDTDKELVEQVEALFESHDLFDTAIVCSFFPSVIYRIKKQNKHILTGITWRRWLVSYQDLEWKTRRHASPLWHGLALVLDVLWMWSIKLWLPQFLGVDMVLTERGEISENYVKYMRARGLQVCAWTVNDEHEMAWMAQKLEIPFLTDVPHRAFPVVKGISDDQQKNMMN